MTYIDDEVGALLAEDMGPPIHGGKQRDSFKLPADRYEDPARIVQVTNRFSTHDFGWPFRVKRSGETLNAITVHLKNLADRQGIPTDQIAFGRGLDQYLGPKLRENPNVWKTVSLVREMDMIPGEIIPRAALTKSAAKQYLDPANNRVVYGYQLPEGMLPGDMFEEPLLTATTKAEVGHDLPLKHAEFFDHYPGLRETTFDTFRFQQRTIGRVGLAFYPDTKYEFGVPRHGPYAGRYVLGDEVGTLYSSRLWLKFQYLVRQRGVYPQSWDKDYARDYFERMWQVNQLDPKLEADRQLVASLPVPAWFTESLSELCLASVPIITGMSLETLQEELFKIR